MITPDPFSCPRASRFLAWVTSDEHKWISLGERRRNSPDSQAIAIVGESPLLYSSSAWTIASAAENAERKSSHRTASPNDNAPKFAIQCCTTTGTVRSNPIPQGLDLADPQPPSTTCGLAVFSVGSTLTAAAFIHQWAQNQRQAYRCWPYDNTKALVVPATASNGIALMPLVAIASAVNFVFTLTFEE